MDSDISVEIKGIPCRWKVFYVVFVLIPKFCILKFTCQVGVNFLMESSSIESVIVNAVALQFMLQIDNMVFEHLMGRSVRRLMNIVRDDPNPCEKEDVFVQV